MPLKNYTTTIHAEKTISEIQTILVKHGARAILTEYGPDGLVSAVSFKIHTPGGEIDFRLPASVSGVLDCLKKDAPRSLRTEAQATRVAWRIIKDWIAAQLALVEVEMVNIVQVFMPYAIGSDGITLGEKLLESPQKLLGQSK